jgi:hypothetical protein
VSRQDSVEFQNDHAPAVARELASELVDAGGGHIDAILLYGSQLHRSSPSPHSAWDLVVLVDAYPPFHSALSDSGHHTRSPSMLNLMGSILPPYVTAFEPWGDGRPLAKCLVLTRAQFQRAMGPRSQDHFLKGRLVQHVEVVWARSAEVVESVEDTLASARRETLDWVAPFLGDEIFDVSSYTKRMLSVSFAGEVRPEAADRVMEVWRSQEGWLESRFEEVLEDAAEDGVLEDLGNGRFRLAHPPGAWARKRRQLYFRSKYRSVARWSKHIVTFNDWLTYIQRKVERRTGMDIPLTPAERKWPLLLLWPKVFRVLREGRRVGSDRELGS